MTLNLVLTRDGVVLDANVLGVLPVLAHHAECVHHGGAPDEKVAVYILVYCILNCFAKSFFFTKCI